MTEFLCAYFNALQKHPRIPSQSKPVQLLRDAVHLMTELAKSLDILHAHSIFHLDLKPTNVLIRPDARTGVPVPTIIDFGLAVEFPRVRGGGGHG